ncbi:unnamed protein product, partial [Trifolium pratense]
MYFFLTLKKVVNVLNEDIPVLPDASASGTNELTVTNGEIHLWKEHDYLCKNYIINGLADDLYDYYRSYNTAKDVWEALTKKYDTEEAGAKKYAVSRYLKYQMVDERSVEAQSHEIQKIAHEIITEGMPLDEQFQIAVIIDKLPPSWKDFKNILRHKTKEFSIESLITRLRIEEESRRQDMKEEEKILVVSNNNKKKSTAAAAAYAAMITEINMIGVTDGWWIDTGATRHVCYERAMFRTYTIAENKKVQMGNAHTSEVAGIGDIELKFTSGKTLILKDVMHVPDMKKNLVSGFLLNKAGFSQTIGADLYTITKNGIFIGKGYAADGMFKLNVDLNLNLNKISTSVYSLFPAVLEGYSDADWNTLSDDSKATSGFIFNIAGGAVSWKSKKQTI